MTQTTTFAPGDVLSYIPTGGRHCREGMAFVREDGRAVDTYWRATGDYESHVLRAEELATAEQRFNVNDFEALDIYAATSASRWATYAPADRERITSQHGLTVAYYVRRGASPDLETQIANAQSKVEDAESALSTAQWRLECAQQDLAALRERAQA